ncbi:MAG: hypothetical protein ABIL18_07060 [candidate division WOR-3 bacterium]
MRTLGGLPQQYLGDTPKADSIFGGREWLIPTAIVSSGCIGKALIIAIILIITVILTALTFAIEVFAWGLVWFPNATIFSLIAAIAIYLLYRTQESPIIPALIGFFVVFIPSILITLITKKESLKPSNPIFQTIARIVGILGVIAGGFFVMQINRLLSELGSSWLAKPELLLTFAPILFGLYLFLRGWERLF